MNQKKLRRTHLKKEKKIVARKIKEETKIETKTKPKRKIKKIFEYLNKDKKMQQEISDDVERGSSVTPFQSVGQSPAVDKTASDFDNSNLKVKKIRRLIQQGIYDVDIVLYIP